MIPADAPRDEAPWSPKAHRLEALRLCTQGAFAAATTHMEQAVAGAPEQAAWARDLAALLAQQARWDDVVRVLHPRSDQLDAEALTLCVIAAVAAGQAATILPDVLRHPAVTGGADANLLCEVGVANLTAGDHDGGEAFLQRAVAIAPDHVRAHRALAILFHDTNRGESAWAHATALAQLEAASASAQTLLAVTASGRGMTEVSRAARQRARDAGLSPEEHTAAMKLTLMDAAENAAGIRALAQSCFPASAGSPRRRPAAARPRARLRVGYLAGEFWATPQFHFLHGVLAAHDRRLVEVFLYSSARVQDEASAHYRDAAEHWRYVAATSDDDLVQDIADDGIDILVDGSGHFSDHRLAVFARRAAPVQATLPACPCTTGCPEMDLFITDRWCSPTGIESEYTESLLRLDSGCLAYTPPCSPAIPASPKRPTVFGMFQQNGKISPPVWDAVADILRRVPAAQLLLHSADVALDDEGLTRQFMREQLAGRDVDPGRLRFAGPRPMSEHLGLMTSVDIALDTWPYNGQTTTCECLWMGVPVISTHGHTHAGRVGSSLLARVGAGDLVATNPAGYVDAAVALASDPDRVAGFRQTLRQRMRDGGLTDAPRLARALEAAYRSWAEERTSP